MGADILISIMAILLGIVNKIMPNYDILASVHEEIQSIGVYLYPVYYIIPEFYDLIFEIFGYVIDFFILYGTYKAVLYIINYVRGR